VSEKSWTIQRIATCAYQTFQTIVLNKTSTTYLVSSVKSRVSNYTQRIRSSKATCFSKDLKTRRGPWKNFKTKTSWETNCLSVFIYRRPKGSDSSRHQSSPHATYAISKGITSPNVNNFARTARNQATRQLTAKLSTKAKIPKMKEKFPKNHTEDPKRKNKLLRHKTLKKSS
jgi:hypothetical protein